MHGLLVMTGISGFTSWKYAKGFTQKLFYGNPQTENRQSAPYKSNDQSSYFPFCLLPFDYARTQVFWSPVQWKNPGVPMTPIVKVGIRIPDSASSGTAPC